MLIRESGYLIEVNRFDLIGRILKANNDYSGYSHVYEVEDSN